MSNEKCDIRSILFKWPKQDFGSTVSWKTRQGNYKSRIKNDMKSSKIVRNCAKRTVLDR